MLSVSRRVQQDRIEWIEFELHGEKVYVGLSKVTSESNRARLVIDAPREIAVRRVHTPDGYYPREHPHMVISDMVSETRRAE